MSGTDAPLMKIGEVAERLGTTPRALRFYQEQGLVAARRSPAGTRWYTENDVARFRAILRLAEAGLPIARIRELATARARSATGSQASHNVHAQLAVLQHALAAQIGELTRLQTEVSRAAGAVEGCFRCTNEPTRKGCPQCPLNDLARNSDMLSLLWEQDIGTTES